MAHTPHAVAKTRIPFTPIMHQLMQTISHSILAFEMPDDSMYPRISKGDFAVLNQAVDLKGKVDKEILLQFEPERVVGANARRWL
ncbi:hypothetical protein A9R05_04915 [Burkholderia sp. KK1]|nr:hypothetical protein A9R05_04915 [Burkholderia sp. KK1]